MGEGFENIIGRLTIDEVSELSHSNNQRSHKFGFKIIGKITPKKIVTQILDAENVIFERTYIDNFPHVLIATAYYDIHVFLNQHAHNLKMAKRKKAEAEEKERQEFLKKTRYQQLHPEIFPDPEPEDNL